MKPLPNNKITKSIENSLGNCLPVVIPIFVIGFPTLLFLGFILVQINYMYAGEWVIVENNIYSLGSYIFIYLLGSAPKNGLLNKIWSNK